MLKRTSLVLILKEAKKVQRKLVAQQQEKYFEDLKNEVWHKKAVDYTTVFAIHLQKLFFEYQDKVMDLIKNSKTLYVVEKAKDYKTYEYLDELYNKVVVSDIKDVLDTMSKDFTAELEKSFEEYLQYGAIRDSAELVYKDIGMKFNFNKFDKMTDRYLYNKKIKWSKEVSETTEKSIKEILAEGYEKGASSYTIAEKIKEDTNFSFRRAEAIARTEVLSSCNYASYVSYTTSPNVVGYKWSAANDGRTRRTHKKAEGQVRKKGEPFTVGGYKLLYPGDVSLGAPAKEVISCRCTLIPIFEGERENLESNTIYDQENVGTQEWLKAQDDDFQKEYLGGKCKKALFDNGVLEEKNYQIPWKEVKEEILKETIRNLIKTDLPILKTNKRKFLTECVNVLNSSLEKNIGNIRILNINNAECQIKSKSISELTTKELDFIKVQNKGELILIKAYPRVEDIPEEDLKFFFNNSSLKVLLLGHNGKIREILSPKKDISYEEWKKSLVDERDIKRVDNFAENDKIKIDGLKDIDIKAVYDYMTAKSYIINDKLRTDTKFSDVEQELVDNLDFALAKIPKYKGNLSRSLYFDSDSDIKEFLKEYKIGETITYNEFLSTTKGDIYNPDGQVQIYIEDSKNGRDISVFNQKEQEVLYERGAKFTIINVVEHNGKYYILLGEHLSY